MITKKTLIERFIDKFAPGGELRCFFAPGRVNLIGEHIDYSGGFVFPCAIDLGTYLVLRKREDMKLFGFSENIKESGVIEVDLNDTSYDSKRGWMNYVVGIFDTFKKEGKKLEHGFDIYIEGDIPNGAGLSSSASIELVVAYAINEIYGTNFTVLDLVKLSQRSENEYNGVNCGIMDQFSIGFGKKDHAILLDCNNLAYEYVPFNLDDKSIVIINSNKKRALADSKYNERRESCEKALSIFKKHTKIQNLCDLNFEEFEKLKDFLPDGETIKRATHAVTENQRVLKAVDALKNNDLSYFSELMKQSHLSLQNDYEVSVFELDVLAELAWSFEGVEGARMTGAGFGGCTVNIVDNQKIDHFIEDVSKRYNKLTGLTPDFYVTTISDGVHEMGK